MRITEFTPCAGTPHGRFVIALGNFDGVHIGHAEVLRAAVSAAEKIGAASAAWCFETNPKTPGSVICDNAEKESLFAQRGLDAAFFEDFEKVKNMSPGTFVKEYLRSLGCVGVLCGFNFRFGKGASGDPSLLKKLCDEEGLLFSSHDAVTLGGEVVSSSAVRALLESGDVERAAEMLGRRYSLKASVEHGRALGKKLGFATINQYFDGGKLVPRRGVYFTLTDIGGKKYPSVSNVGVRPTVGGHSCRLETHVLDFDGDLYGSAPEVSFAAFRRDEIPFGNEKELKDAMAEDVSAARRFFSEMKK